MSFRSSACPARMSFRSSACPARMSFRSSACPACISFRSSACPASMSFRSSACPACTSFCSSACPARSSACPARMSFLSSACPVRTRAARAANAITTVAIMPSCSVFTAVLPMERGAILTLERARNPSHGPFVRRPSGPSRAGVEPDVCRLSSRRCADAGGDGRKRLRADNGDSLPRQGLERTPRGSPSRSRPCRPPGGRAIPWFAAGPGPGLRAVSNGPGEDDEKPPPGRRKLESGRRWCICGRCDEKGMASPGR